MPRLCMFIDTLGLAADDLWSYYEVLGRPVWVLIAPVLMASAALAAITLV